MTEKLIVVLDCNNGIDDIATISWLLANYKNPILIVTTFWRPEAKASVMRCLVQLFDRLKDVEVVAGSGVYENNNYKNNDDNDDNDDNNENDDNNDYDDQNKYDEIINSILELYPTYSEKIHEKDLLSSFKKNYSDLYDDPVLNICNYPLMIDKFMNKCKQGETIIICMSVMSNVSYIVKHHSDKLKMIVTMGGWETSKLSWNMHMDMTSANVVLGNLIIPVFVFSYDFYNKFEINNKMDNILYNKEMQNKFRKTLCEIGNRGNNSMSNFAMVQVILKYINQVDTKEIHFVSHPENIFMYDNKPMKYNDTRAQDKCMTVIDKPDSNVKVIKTNEKIDNVYEEIVKEFMKVFTLLENT